MQTQNRLIGGHQLTIHSVDTLIVGTGCAGYNAADRLYHYGKHDIAMLTDHIHAGTSRNTGSDKQTYYKLTLSGDEPDSVALMADTLFSGGCVDGEHALCEAALSVQCFLRLCELGVAFPINRYGEYVGYKTDHDPRRRATSVGPLTSHQMTNALEKAVQSKEIPIFDHHQVIAVLSQDNRAVGVLCLCTQEKTMRFTAFLSNYIIYATGGPAGIYQDSCYPLGHYGMSGIAFEAGAVGKNLTEWQYGLASINPRWNVSGTFMQVLPRFVSTDKAGGGAREFLQDYIPETSKLLTAIFLKGYQWPFDAKKAFDGSSVIDLIVYTETKLKGRRVFLDFTENPLNSNFSFEALSPEAYTYLKHAGAVFGTPIERLRHMNMPAVNFYKERGVDLNSEMLEIALCSQHNNGGIGIDLWWQSSVKGFFAVGEAAASHGVYRPGGSALNAGQVGSERAARFIASQTSAPIDMEGRLALVEKKIISTMALADRAMGDYSNLKEKVTEATGDMSRSGAAVRNIPAIRQLLDKTKKNLLEFQESTHIASLDELPLLYRYRDILLSQVMYLSAMEDFINHGGNSRGSGLYSNSSGEKPLEALPECCRFILDDGQLLGCVQEVKMQNGTIACTWRPVHPIPKEDDFFENIWRNFRENGNVY